MAKKIPIDVKRKWLEKYETGTPVIAIATKNKSDTRTVQKALDDARRERDARYARSELMKEALRNHQDTLKIELDNIVKNLEVPRIDFAPLSWYQGDKSIFSIDNTDISAYTVGVAKGAGKPRETITTPIELLRQHLKNDKVWKLLGQCDKAYAAHIADRASYQRKIKYLLEYKTGFKLADRDIKPQRFLYSYIIGPSIYESSIGVVFEGRNNREFEDDVRTDTQTGTVKYRNSIMAEVPGNEEKCRQGILGAFEELLKLPELKNVQDSYKLLKEISGKSRQVAEEISLLGFIPGSCRVCQRLGM
jgi:hypothetical protein